MIISSMQAGDNWSSYPEAIRAGLEYLKNGSFMDLEPGEYPIRGKDIYAKVFDVVTGTTAEKLPESHEDYIDIHYLVSGEERLGFAFDFDTGEVAERKDEDDLIFYHSVQNENFVTVVPGNFCVCYPYDVHRPAVAVKEPQRIRKVVVKVRVSLIQAI